MSDDIANTLIFHERCDEGHLSESPSAFILKLSLFYRVDPMRVLLQILLAAMAIVAVAEDGSYTTQFSVCADSIVQIEELSVVCDSPGAYYYGSKKYRNSQSCVAGDKAKVDVLMYIADGLEADAYVDLSVRGFGSVESKQVLSKNSLCNNVQSVNGRVSCPASGYYKLHQNFYWGQQSDNYNYSFVPKAYLGISSGENKNQYDLGGANVDNCAGNTFTSWTTGVRKSAGSTVQTFLVTFGILLASVLGILGLGYFIFNQSGSTPVGKPVAKDSKTKALMAESGDSEDDENETFAKMSMMGRHSNLVDF